MRYPGRTLGSSETPSPAMLGFVTQQLEINPAAFDDYARRDETRRDHAKEIQHYLGLHPTEREDRRAVLIAASTAADATDSIRGPMIPRDPAISGHCAQRIPHSIVLRESISS